ncbi:MAG: lipopolysaccharide assembly protein LapB [Enterobacterales bacterium]|nr:lipopolysaccharide assembly protein LapB [Enterobacterales bacterium]
MNELLAIFIILLPIAWYFGYRNGKRREVGRSHGRQHGLSKTYFTGLNYLLKEESDKAIDTFVSMLEVDSETVETHLALGNLFRKRGEVNRSIRIHQNLIARPSLSPEDRKQALLELGHDYMSAGLLDRAENIFNELATDSTHQQACLAQLLTIYQQTKDWQKAIATAARMSLPANNKNKSEISHFYCELAEEALENMAYRDAIGYIKKAFNADAKCVRATLIGGEIHYSNGRYKQALASFKELTRQDIAFLPEAMERLVVCYQKLKDEKGLRLFLQEALNKGGGISSILAYAQIIQRGEGDKKAADFIASQMAQHPSVKGLLKLIELHIEHASESAIPSLTMLHQVVSKLLENKPIYHCDTCGFDAKTLFWQCPSCKCWGSVKPIQGIEGE